jgi:hypothetical protein
MNYTDTAGNPATGVVWSPGPLPGTVWVLPHSGASASEARVVHVRKREEVDNAERIWWLKKPEGYTSPDCWALLQPAGIPTDATPIEIAAHRQAFNDGRGLPPKDWHAALGYDPRDVVRRAAAGSAPPAAALMLDLAVA